MMDRSGSTSLLEYAAGTTTGARRDVNEDAFGVFPERHVFVVVDGCGGGSSGASAARLAVEKFAELPQREPDFAREVGLTEADPLALAVLRANIEIFREGQTKAELRGQAATLCAVRASAKMMSIVHVGDCRVGCYREGRLAWLTEDHTVLAELRKGGGPEAERARLEHAHQLSLVLARGVGIAEHVAVDLSYHPAEPGDLYLLCTDGLTGHVDHTRISELDRISDLPPVIDNQPGPDLPGSPEHAGALCRPGRAARARPRWSSARVRKSLWSRP